MLPDEDAYYHIILDHVLHHQGKKIANNLYEKAVAVLKSLKKTFNDFFNMILLHYINAGPEGLALTPSVECFY